jgi:rhodanese-related sulfurtransferase
MKFKKWAIVFCVFFFSIGQISIDPATANVRAGGVQVLAQAKPDQSKAPEIAHITAEELKAKLAKNEQVMIIDLRASATYNDDPNRIKGAFHMKERRLRYRLSFSPFKELPRDRLIVTYCACPSDEISTRAAQVLLESGFKNARVLKGGWQAWLKAGGQLEAKPKV